MCQKPADASPFPLPKGRGLGTRALVAPVDAPATNLVQVNGKLRDVIKVPAAASQAELEAVAKGSTKVKPFLEGKTVKKVIVLPKKLVNIVVG